MTADRRDAQHRGEPRPRATIAIITRNRKDDLRAALRSSLEQEGGPIEILVLDDGSTDGTNAMVVEEFPGVRLVRYDDDAGVAARRNDAAEIARSDVIVSIDDDAVFSSSRVVADTLRDLDHPRLAAVTIPYVDVGIVPDVQQRAPDPDGRWVTTVFRATAYAIRREALIEVGGYSTEIKQFGEEWDLSLKLLDAGYLIRLGRSDLIYHHASPKRDVRRMDVLYRRNEMLISWMYFPFPWHLVYMAGYAVRGLRIGVQWRRPGNSLLGLAAGIGAVARSRHRRRPISRAAFQVDQWARSRVRAGSALRLVEAEAKLGPLGPPPKPPDGGWPRPVSELHGPLRRARVQLTRAVGRPVRCELCGEVLFRGVPFVWRGRLKLLGAETTRVRADWDKMNRMAFRHVEVDRCTGHR